MYDHSTSAKRAKKSRSGERGGALLVALVVLVVVLAMIELMLAAPNAELMKARSAFAREVSLASADAGLKDAARWLTVHARSLNDLLGSPVFGAFEGQSPVAILDRKARVVVTRAIASNQGESGPVVVELGDTLGAKNGGYPFPGRQGTAAFDDSNLVHFGDRAARSSYAYRIAALGNNFFQVDVEGRAEGVNGTFFTRFRAALWVQMPREFAAVIFLQQGRDSRFPFGPSSPGVITTKGVVGIAINGQDLSPGKGRGKAAPGLMLPPVPGLIVMDPNGGVVAPSTELKPSPLTTAFLEKLVAAAASTAETLPNGVGETPLSATGSRFLGARWEGEALVQGSRLTEPVGMGVANYLKIEPRSTVSGPIWDYEKPSAGPPAGLIIIDVGDGVTFAQTPLFRFNKQHFFAGTVIFFQRGSINFGAGNTQTIAGVGASQGPPLLPLILGEHVGPSQQQYPPAPKTPPPPIPSLDPDDFINDNDGDEEPPAPAQPPPAPPQKSNGLFQYASRAVDQAMGFWTPYVTVASFTILQ